ncbi:DUF1015 domain-containing protein [Roseburia hominis]
MATIVPFCGLRPNAFLASKIASLPYDVYSRAEAKKIVENNPYSFLKIDRAETQFDYDINMYSDRVYQKASETLQQMKATGEFIKDSSPCYYIYELVMEGRSQTGIVGCAAIDDYCDGIIMKHEDTRYDKELDRIKHVSICNAQTGPIFLTYRSNDMINGVIFKIKNEEKLYCFTSEDGIRHNVWKVAREEDMNIILNAFKDINQIYIADGHHRAAAAVKVGLSRRKEDSSYKSDEEFDYFLSVLFPDSELMVMDYNRIVIDLNGYTPEEFLERVKVDFKVTVQGSEPYKPKTKGVMGMYLDKKWYSISEKAKTRINSVKDLDVSILQDKILGPILGIVDPKTDQRIKFFGGIRGLKILEMAECGVAFSMYPTSVNELFSVADAGLRMPPKSTWFEPKLRSGLFIHEI